jgi:uncharacterized membrane protein YebE (DUF533 family)
MPAVDSRVLDNGLTVLDTESTHLYLCSSEPTTYTQATSTYALGNNNFGAGAVFGAPAAGSPNGRKVSSAAVTAGSVTANGTAAYLGVTDNTNSRFHASLALGASQVVTSGNTWAAPSFDIRLPSA